MSNDKLNLDELNSLLGSPSPAIQEKTEVVIEVKKSNFLYKQYPLFSCPVFSIYIQGVLPCDAFDVDDIKDWLPYAIFRRIGRVESSSLKALLTSIESEGIYKMIYVNKDIHKGMLGNLINLGVKLDKEKVANPTFYLASLNNYMGDLVDFLSSLGYQSPKEYLEANKAKTSISSGLTIDELNSLWDSL